jgi:7-cyano-7-deazaguanine synthase
MKRAVVLLSGGIDSTTTLAIAIAEGYEAYALSFDYGQRHEIEVEAARRVANSLDAKEHRVARIDPRIFGGSALTDDIDVPKQRSETEIAHGIPVTYVPARNTIFLAYALAWAEVLSAADIFLGVNAIDYSGYPDCRSEFIQAFQTLANVGTKAGIAGARLNIHTPLITLSKSEIIGKACELGVDLGLTHRCYDPSPEGLACGECDSCLLRLKGFREAGIEDPIRYAQNESSD